MSSIETSPNSDEIAFWNGRSGEKWVQYQENQDRMLRPHGDRAIAAAGIAPGDGVLDIGCGCGDTTLQIARITGEGGAATGLDVSGVMLAHARARATAEPGLHVEFDLADAEVYAFSPGGASVIYSRFGVMFFQDPVAAFANMRSALDPDGRLAFVCWQELPQNPWVNIPFTVAGRHIDMPAPAAPDASGPFAFADPGRVERILRDAGFDGIDIEPYSPDLTVGRSLDEAVKYLMQMTPVAGAVAEAGPEMRGRISDDLGRALEPLAGTDGVKAGSASWVVTARAA